MFIVDYLTQYNRYMLLFGIMVIFGIAFLFSNNRRRINIRLVLSAFCLQLVFAWFMLWTPFGKQMMAYAGYGIKQIYVASEAGIKFVFGSLGVNQAPWGVVFAFQVLPMIIFFGAFMALLFHFGIIQFFVRIIARLVRPILGTSGAETLCAVANSFLGQTDAPLVIKNYLDRMTQSEIFLIMVGGMGHISVSLVALYALWGISPEHLLSASLMALPATVMIAKIMCPEVEKPETAGGAAPSIEVKTLNALDAIATGTSDGLHLVLNIAAMLIAFISLIALINMMLGWGAGWVQSICDMLSLSVTIPALSLESIFAVIFMPISWLLGLTGAEALIAGKLLGLKVVANELIAYSQLAVSGLSARGTFLLTYALCGFSNFSSIGIQIGGIGALAPSKRHLLSAFGFRAILGGVMVNLLSAMVAGLFL